MGTSFWLKGSYPTIQCTTFHWLSEAAGSRIKDPQ